MKEIIEKLQLLEIPRREGEIYLALLQNKEFTAPEIAKITSVSRTKAYEILQNLVKKGLCNESYRNGIKIFSGVDPNIVIDNIQAVYEKKKNIADQLKGTLSEIFLKIKTVNETLDYIQILTDSGQIREKWLKIQKNTKKELLVFVKPPYTGSVDDNMEQENEIVKQKVTCRGLYEYKSITSLVERDNLIRAIESYERMGEQVKLTAELPMKLVISDGTISMFALNDRVSLSPSLTTMIIDHPNFSVTLKKVFEVYWASAITIQEFKEDPDKYVNFLAKIENYN